MKYKLIGKHKVCLDCIRENVKLSRELGLTTIINANCKHIKWGVENGKRRNKKTIK